MTNPPTRDRSPDRPENANNTAMKSDLSHHCINSTFKKYSKSYLRDRKSMMNTSRNKTKAEMAEEIAMLQKRVKKLEKTESKPRQTEIKLGNNGNNLGLLNSIIEETTDVIFVKDLKGRHLLVNSACAQIIGKSVKQIIGKNNEQLFPPEVARHLTKIDKQIIASGKPQTLEEVVLPAGSDSARTYLTTKAPLRDDNDYITGLIGIARDITERKQASRMLATQSEVLRMIALGVGLTEILARLCLLIEQQSAGALCSILLFDEAGGKLHSGAAPSLPQKYARALDGLMVGEGQGSCGTAVTRGKQVIVYDIAKDPLWAGFRKLALKHGIRSCWSTPFSSKEKVLGTFAISHKVPCRPTPYQQQLIQNATHLAGIATERKQAEEALCESEERYRSIVKQASDGFVLYDLDTKHVLDTNQAYEQMLGYTAEEMRRLTLYDIVAHDRQSIKSFVKRIREEKQVWIGERKHRCKDGSLLDVEVSSSLIVYSGKEVLTTVVRDISERRRAEEALRESDEKFRFLAENMADIVWTVDLDFRSAYASPSIKKVLGFTPEERKRHAPEEMLTPESLQRLTMKMQEELRRDKEQDVDPERYVTIEAEYYHAEGHTVWLENCVKALRDKSGAIIGLYGSARDITERKHAERALRKSEENNRLLVENSPHCIHQIDLQGRLISVNPSCVTMAGVSNELDIIGMRYLDTVADVDRDRIEQFLGAALKGEASEFEFRSSTEHIFASSFIPIFDDNGDVIRLMGISQDITERKQVEEALRASEEKYRKIFENVRDVFYRTDYDGTITDISPSIERHSGYTREELIGKQIADYYFDRNDYMELWKKLDDDGEINDFEIQLKDKNDSFVYFSVNARIVFGIDGKPVATEGMLRDITERKQAEDIKSVLFQISEATSVSSNLEQLLEIIRQKIGVLLDTTNFYVALYHAGTDLYSFPYYLDEHEESKDFSPQHLNKSLTDYVRRTGVPFLANEEVHAELMQRGEVKMVGTPSAQWLGVPLKTAHAVIGVVVVQSYTNPALYSEKDLGLMTFVSEQIALAIERKLAEEQLSMLSLAVEQSPAGVIITDPQGNIEYVNPKYTQVSGYTAEEVVGSTPSILKSGKTLPEEYKKVWDTITTGDEWRGEFHNKKKNGEPYWESLSITGVKNSAGVTRHFLIVLEDITGHRQAEKKRKQLEERLHQAQKMETLGTLAGGIAHDFNNILQAIDGFVDLSLDEVPPESQAYDDLQEVMKAANRGKNLVQQILAFSRREVRESTPLRIHPIVKEALGLLKATLPVNIDLRQALSRKCGTVLADPGQIHQVVMNLCANAFQAMSKNGGMLTVSLEKFVSDDEFLQNHPKLNQQEYVQLTVSDTGIGMGPETKERVFEPFFTTKDVGEGTGLGLSVVHGIVMSHKGDITVESEPAKGTTFRVYLPVIKKGVTQITEKVQQIPAGHERILLVDDQEIVVSVMKRLLQRNGYEVTTSSSGVESLETFRAQPGNYDLVITDQIMPEMTGLKLAGELLNIRPDLPIILMSGFAEDVSGDSVKTRGIKEFILKPISADDLSKAVRRAMDENR